jgi:hypothetical protein
VCIKSCKFQITLIHPPLGDFHHVRLDDHEVMQMWRDFHVISQVEISLDRDACPHPRYVVMTFVSSEELMVKTATKYMFLLRERGVWDSLCHQNGLLA